MQKEKHQKPEVLGTIKYWKGRKKEMIVTAEYKECTQEEYELIMAKVLRIVMHDDE